MLLEMAPIRETSGDGDEEGDGRLLMQNSTKMFRSFRKDVVPASVRRSGGRRWWKQTDSARGRSGLCGALLIVPQVPFLTFYCCSIALKAVIFSIF